MPEPLDLPSAIDASTSRIVTRYAQAEQQLIAATAAVIAQHLATDTQGPDTRLLLTLRNIANRITTPLALSAPQLATTAAATAAKAGNAAAIKEVTDALADHPTVREIFTRNIGDTTPHGLRAAGHIAAGHIAADLLNRLTTTHSRITRFADDAYRAATAPAAIGQVTGGTPQGAQRAAWRQLTADGVTGFKDSAGRDWELSTYVEMAARTAAIRAFNASHQDRMQDLGIGYWTVGPSGFPCKLCMPWEGRVLADAGAGTYQADHATEDRKITVHVAGTLEEARAAGLQHPNCKHTLIAYFPGITKLRTRTADEVDEAVERFKETQRLRAMERAVRRSKTAELAALTDLDRQTARRRTRDLQARIRDYTAQTGLNPRPRREQLDLANK